MNVLCLQMVSTTLETILPPFAFRLSFQWLWQSLAFNCTVIAPAMDSLSALVFNHNTVLAKACVYLLSYILSSTNITQSPPTGYNYTHCDWGEASWLPEPLLCICSYTIKDTTLYQLRSDVTPTLLARTLALYFQHFRNAHYERKHPPLKLCPVT